MGLSRRTQVRRQAKFAANHIDGAILNLAAIDGIAAGESEKISRVLPQLVVMLDTMQKLLEQFRRQL